MAHPESRSLKIDLPAGATLVVLMAQGFPAGGVWPIVHVDLGAQGGETFYVRDSRIQAAPLVLALERPVAARQSATAVVSLLNADPAAEAQRNVVISEMFVF